MQQQTKEFIDNIITADRNEEKVTVLPLRCGLGKSTYIANRIIETVESDTTDGMIIVTDSINRLREYVNMADIVNKYQQHIMTMTADNINEAVKKQNFCKILLMTTQRYFRLSQKEIMELTKWKNGRRTTIIFDEKPFIREDRQLTIKDFNDVDSALEMGIDDDANQTDKAWCITEWRKLTEHIRQQMDDYENLCEKDHFYLWHTDEWQSMTDDDTRFTKFVEKNKNKIASQKYTDAYRNIQHIRQIFTDGAIFSCHKKRSGAYFKCFTLMIDNRGKLTNLGAKVFVLDGSADITPEYDADYLDIIDCSAFGVPLNNLKIDCVNINTSRNHIIGNAENPEAIQAIQKYIREKCQNPTVFTYEDAEKHFTEYPTNHFGNIKGRNDYRKCAEIVQVGLNRFPELTYFLRTEAEDISMEIIKSLSPEESIQAFEKIFSFNKINNFLLEDTMMLSLLADIEQNLFRGVIRNIASQEEMRYTIFFDTDNYAYLVDLLKKRYGNKGATINVIPTPIELQLSKKKNRNTTKETSTQRFLKWYEIQQSGRIFKTSEMRKETGLSQDQFKEVKRSIPELIHRMKTTTNGVYQIP